jgi:hypothetical protein
MSYSGHHLNERGDTSYLFLIRLDDIDNQSASTIARQYDKNGTRTIGIHSGFLNLIKVSLQKPTLWGKESMKLGSISSTESLTSSILDIM